MKYSPMTYPLPLEPLNMVWEIKNLHCESVKNNSFENFKAFSFSFRNKIFAMSLSHTFFICKKYVSIEICMQ